MLGLDLDLLMLLVLQLRERITAANKFAMREETNSVSLIHNHKQS